MRIAYVGNFGPAHSTENHVAASLESLGHDVVRVQENDPPVAYAELPRWIGPHDLLLWTRTWDVDHDGQLAMLDRYRTLGVPTVGFHLDLYVGLDREPQLDSLPWWRCDLMFTPDGDHDHVFLEKGINHVYCPPAVFHDECYLADPDYRRFGSDVAFVGSWRRYHREYPFRRHLVPWLRSQYRNRFRMWGDGGPSVRGHDLNVLYASTKVAVGDSCFSGRLDTYLSDRVFETLGRGGFLVHPASPALGALGLEDGVHLGTYTPGDLRDLKATIDRWLADPEGREAARRKGHEHVTANHTYRHRMEFVLREVFG